MEARMDETEEGLMQAFRDGDADAFAALYKHHKTAVFSYLRLHAFGAEAEALHVATWKRFVDARDEPLGDGGVPERLFRIAHGLVVEAAAQSPTWDQVEQREIAAAEDRLRDI